MQPHDKLRDLGLAIEGTRLEPIVAAFRDELRPLGLLSLDPEFYLATEWGVPFPSRSIAIPFYLARPELARYHAEQTGLVEGASRADILRYLRHEMGHVVNYCYQLYNRDDWTQTFGPFSRPYPDEYTPRPFDPNFVAHLPGWYAQKHPDEDWSETFAVWMTPGLDWRADYRDWPGALRKLEYVDRVVRGVAGMPALDWPEEPQDVVTVVEVEESEEDGEFDVTVEQFYAGAAAEIDLPGLDGALRGAFDDAAPDPDLDGDGEPDQLPAGDLARKLEADLVMNVFRWTGHFPERALALVRRVAQRADELHQVYDRRREASAAVALTALVTSLAMNHVYRGDYFPATE